MADPMTGPAPRCQWCSAALPAPDLPTCPSCGATLTSTTGGEEIKGVTTLDTEAIIRARSEAARPRSRLLSFITGEQPVELNVGEAESLAPPDDAVRLEMRRLELEAERVDLEAEAVAMKTDVVVEQGIDLAAMADTSPSAPAAPAPTAPAAAAAAAPAPVAAAEPAPDADAAPAAPPPPPAG